MRSVESLDFFSTFLISAARRRRKRSFLWQFPQEREGSGVPNIDYYNILANETIKLELEIVSIHQKFKKVPPVEMSWVELTALLHQKGTFFVHNMFIIFEEPFICCFSR